MRRLLLILLMSVAALAGCRRDPLPDGAGEDQVPRELGIYIECPGMPGTRGDQGNVPAMDAEFKVHTLQVWIFTSTDHEPLYYLSLAGEDQLPAPGHTRRYAIPIDSEFARRNPLPEIDVFALANAASVGCTLDGDSDWDAVSDSGFIGDEWFGVSSPVREINSELGLPMSGTRRQMRITPSDDGVVLNAEKTVDLVRAVSKIRYVFCRMQDDDDPDGENVSIQKIVLNGGQIPVQEYLFTTDQSFRIGSDYEARSIETAGPAVIAPNDSPEKLVYAGQNATTYDQLLNDAIEDGILTDGGVMYLRESDKALTGTISFVTEGVEHTRVFSMAAAGDFARNHSWTVFGYFISGRKIELSINALPWDYSHYHIDYSVGSTIATKMEIDENTATVKYNETDGYNDVFFLLNKPAVGKFNIISPVNGQVLIHPIGDANAFLIEPDIIDIRPDVNGGDVEVRIRPNPDFHGSPDENYSITLSFFVKLIDGSERDANSEINREKYRFWR